MALNWVYRNRTCDYCDRDSKPAWYFTTTNDDERDICINCVEVALKHPPMSGIVTTFATNLTPNILNQTNMLNAFIKRLVDKETQILIKAGYLNNDLSVTNAGNAELLALFLEANKKAFVESAKAKLEEDKESKS